MFNLRFKRFVSKMCVVFVVVVVVVVVAVVVVVVVVVVVDFGTQLWRSPDILCDAFLNGLR